MTFLGLMALFLTSLLVIALITRFTEGRRLAQVEQLFYDGRKPLSDTSYLEQLPSCKSPSLQIAARRTMASLCGTAPEMIHPTDSMRSLMDMQYDRGYVNDFIFFIEAETGRRVERNDIPKHEECEFADYVERLTSS